MKNESFQLLAKRICEIAKDASPSQKEIDLGACANGLCGEGKRLPSLLADNRLQLRITDEKHEAFLGRRFYCSAVHTDLRVRKTACVSSRLPRNLDDQDAWFRALRATVMRSHRRGDTFLFSPGTAAAKYVKRATELFGRQSREVVVPPGTMSLSEWLAWLSKRLERHPPAIFVSPLLDVDANEMTEFPTADRALFAFSDRIVVLGVRRWGNIHRMVQLSLERRLHTSGNVYLNLAGNDAAVTSELMGAGAVGLHLRPSPSEMSTDTSPRANESADAPIIPLATVDSKRFVAHWTRRRRGPWPGQSEDEFLDELILNLPQRKRSILTVLAKILVARRILATSRSRDGFKYVSFTEVPLDEWSTHRTFRAHRGRWDFEPYGIGVDREAMLLRGGRRVIYGTEDDWRCLSPDDRYLFQRAYSVTQKGNRIDWTSESELRMKGDFDLSPLSPTEAIVFVPTLPEAEQLQSLSPWPIVVLDDGRRPCSDSRQFE